VTQTWDTTWKQERLFNSQIPLFAQTKCGASFKLMVSGYSRDTNMCMTEDLKWAIMKGWGIKLCLCHRNVSKRFLLEVLSEGDKII